MALAMVDGADDRAVLDVEVRIHAEVRELLLEGAWTAARQRAMELRRVLRDEGYQPDGGASGGGRVVACGKGKAQG